MVRKSKGMIDHIYFALREKSESNSFSLFNVRKKIE